MFMSKLMKVSRSQNFPQNFPENFLKFFRKMDQIPQGLWVGPKGSTVEAVLKQELKKAREGGYFYSV